MYMDDIFERETIRDLVSHGVIPDKYGAGNKELDRVQSSSQKLMGGTTLTYERIEAVLRQKKDENRERPVKFHHMPTFKPKFHSEGAPNISFILKSASRIQLGIGIRSAVRKYEYELAH